VRWDLVALLLASVGVFLGAVALMQGIFTGNLGQVFQGVVMLATSGVVGFVFLKTPILEYLNAFLSGHNTLLVVFRPGRQARHIAPDRVGKLTADVGSVKYWLIPGTAYHEKGFTIYPVVELVAATFPANAPPALREVSEKYGINSMEDIKRLAALASDPNVPEEERQRIRAVLADIDAIFKRWGQSFDGDSVAAWLANLSPQALKATVDHEVAAATASMRMDISWKMVIVLAIVLMGFLVGLYLIISHGNAPAASQTVNAAAEVAKKVVEANATNATTTLVG